MQWKISMQIYFHICIDLLRTQAKVEIKENNFNLPLLYVFIFAILWYYTFIDGASSQAYLASHNEEENTMLSINSPLHFSHSNDNFASGLGRPRSLQLWGFQPNGLRQIFNEQNLIFIQIGRRNFSVHKDMETRS